MAHVGLFLAKLGALRPADRERLRTQEQVMCHLDGRAFQQDSVRLVDQDAVIRALESRPLEQGRIVTAAWRQV